MDINYLIALKLCFVHNHCFLLHSLPHGKIDQLIELRMSPALEIEIQFALHCARVDLDSSSSSLNFWTEPMVEFVMQ